LPEVRLPNMTFRSRTPAPDRQEFGRLSGLRGGSRYAIKVRGADDPSNMQWQTTEDAKIKDKTE